MSTTTKNFSLLNQMTYILLHQCKYTLYYGTIWYHRLPLKSITRGWSTATIEVVTKSTMEYGNN